MNATGDGMPAGRPSEFDPAYVEQAAKLCALGATDDEMADFFGVHRATIYRWKLDYPEFCDAIKSAKDIADERVERSLYQKATGYEITEETAVKLKKAQYEEEVEVVEVRKHIPADTTAAIFWLKNRRKDEWRDKIDHEHAGKLDADITHHGQITLSDTAQLIADALGRRTAAASREPGAV